MVHGLGIYSLSGAPFVVSIPAERVAFEPVRIIAGVQIVLHYEGLSKSFVNILLYYEK